MNWIIAIVLLISMQSVYAATIHGNIYGSSLEVVEARVFINTTPMQFLIAKQGEYSFEVANGFYSLVAQNTEEGVIIASETRNISIRQPGSYVIDFVLFPSFIEEDEMLETPELSFPETQSKNNALFHFLLVAVILVLSSIGAIYYWKTKKKKGARDEDNNLNQLLEIIKKEGGRMTQKDLRKQIPLSEAKISLMVAELEHKGKIEKIKKGRGNIIILK